MPTIQFCIFERKNMRKKLIIVPLVALIVGVTSCNRNSDQAQKESDEVVCSYSYNKDQSTLEWTAFKFTEKSPVKGSFNTIKIEGLKKSDDPKKMIESLTFSIATNSVETQNEERNAKIASLFFKTIHTETITGKVKSLGKDGKAVIVITMNNLSKDVEGTYTLEDGKFSFHATIDVLKWNASEGIQTLNTACKDLHTGADGKSKLWSEVEIAFTTELMMECE